MKSKQLLNQLNEQSLSYVQLAGTLADELGMKAYLVGGPVRDLVLGRSNLDLDIALQGNGMRMAEIFAQRCDAKVMRYPAFKTATVTLPDGRMIDFATARKETYKRPGDFPAIVGSDIEHDLSRRDFTINAMAISINATTWGQLIDPLDGQKDLCEGKIRILHDRSFIDDPTRIVRAARFKARFNFMIERHTMKLLEEAIAASALKTITVPRYGKEIKKIKNEQDSTVALDLLKAWGAIKGDIHAY